MEHDVPGDGHCVLEVSFNLVENVFGRPAEEDGARLGGLTLREEGKVFVADFGDFEEATVCADVLFAEVFDAVDDGGAGGAGEAVIVCFADAA